jgi:hypothetical protein
MLTYLLFFFVQLLLAIHLNHRRGPGCTWDEHVVLVWRSTILMYWVFSSQFLHTVLLLDVGVSRQSVCSLPLSFSPPSCDVHCSPLALSRYTFVMGKTSARLEAC